LKHGGFISPKQEEPRISTKHGLLQHNNTIDHQKQQLGRNFQAVNGGASYPANSSLLQHNQMAGNRSSGSLITNQNNPTSQSYNNPGGF